MVHIETSFVRKSEITKICRNNMSIMVKYLYIYIKVKKQHSRKYQSPKLYKFFLGCNTTVTVVDGPC